MHALTLHRAGASPERIVVPEAVRAGGSHADAVYLPGLPPGALRLEPCPSGIVVEAIASGVRVAGRPVSPGARRLLRPGERADLHDAQLVLDADPPAESTRAVAAALLRSAAAGMPHVGPHLVVLTGPAAGARHPLGATQTIGRGRTATIRIADPHASRVHARLRLGPDGATVEDLSSKNGLRVNGIRIDRAWTLRPGEELGIGETSLAIDVLGGGCVEATPAAGAPHPRPKPRFPHLLAAALLALSAAALALASS